MHQPYPKWIYSRTGSQIITSEEEHPGAGWVESPADIPSDEPALAAAAAVPVADAAAPESAPTEKRKPGLPRKES